MSGDFKISIKKEQISAMPLEAFTGEITVVDTPELAQEAIAVLKNETMIGFDTETKPSFQKGRVNKMALMQLSTATHCYLFRLNVIGIDKELGELLEDESITKIGLSIHDDFNVMNRTKHINPRGFIDLQQLVKEYHINDISLQKIFAILFGHRISKSQRLTNWEAQRLSPQQQIYAATDAWACLKIYHYLKSGKFDPAASPYIAAEEPTKGEGTEA